MIPSNGWTLEVVGVFQSGIPSEMADRALRVEWAAGGGTHFTRRPECRTDMAFIWNLNQLYDRLYYALTQKMDANQKAILNELGVIRTQGTIIMADISQVQADQAAELSAIVDLKTAVTGAVTAIQAEAAAIADNTKTIADLKAQIAAGTPVTQAQLDALDTSITGATSTIQQQAAALAAAVAPPAAG